MIPSWKQPSVVRRSPLNATTTAGPSGSHPHRVSTDLEVGLQALFENLGLSIPNPAEDVSGTSNSIRFILRIHVYGGSLYSSAVDAYSRVA